MFNSLRFVAYDARHTEIKRNVILKRAYHVKSYYTDDTNDFTYK